MLVGLQDEQRIWCEEKERAIGQAGRDTAGGSVYTLIVNIEAAELTEKRTKELYELIKQIYFCMTSIHKLEVLSCV